MRYSLRTSAFLCRNEAAATHFLKLFPLLGHSSSQKPVIQKIPSGEKKNPSGALMKNLTEDCLLHFLQFYSFHLYHYQFV